jgi:alkylhydroperoxidase family enzyme
MERSDVQALEDAGFDHGAILAIAEVTAYYAYVNRIAEGLGLELEPDPAD